MMEQDSFANVWEALSETPEEAQSMTARSDLMTAIRNRVKRWNVTQAVAANRLDITQPRLNDLLQGKIAKFNLEALMTIASRAELVVEVTVREGKRAAA
jgi:predicted XRE-type DNA-binding protein